uniref:Uncharacterized protein n=1 Tax=Arundo donax TaxID=35708 RepID=A0A0A9FL52_ARUDO
MREVRILVISTFFGLASNYLTTMSFFSTP